MPEKDLTETQFNQEKPPQPETEETSSVETHAEREYGEESSSEEEPADLEQVRTYIEEYRDYTSAISRRSGDDSWADEDRRTDEYAWLANVAPEERAEIAYQYILKGEKRMVEAVDAFLVIDDYAHLDEFETKLREHQHDLIEAGVLTSYTNT